MKSQPMGILPMNNASKHSNTESLGEQNVINQPSAIKLLRLIDYCLIVNLL